LGEKSEGEPTNWGRRGGSWVDERKKRRGVTDGGGAGSGRGRSLPEEEESGLKGGDRGTEGPVQGD